MTNAMDMVQAGWRLSYDRAAVAEILADGELSFGDAIAQAAEGAADGLDTIREIVNAVGGSAVWKSNDDKQGTSDVCAEFTCDDEGHLTNDYHLTLSAFLDSGVLVADTGLRDMRSLPCDELATVYDVLDGVTALLNESIVRAGRALIRPMAPALRMVQASDLRSALASSEPNSELPPLTDTRLERALIATWPLVEARYRQLQAELLGAAERTMLVAARAGARPAALDQRCAAEFVHTIAIDVYEHGLAVTWPGGSTSLVERDDPASGDQYEALADALDAIETNRDARACPFHDGDQRDSTACTCGESAEEGGL